MTTEIERAQAELDAWDKAHQVGPTDPGVLSMRFHETQSKRDKGLNTYLNRLGREARERARLVEAVKKAKRDARVAALPKTPVDPAELKGATEVLVLRRGSWTEWHRVKRVNPKTVTCYAPEPGFDEPRFLHGVVVGVRHG